MRTRVATAAFVLVAALAGCNDGNQPPFPDLHPVQGVVERGGRPVNGGLVRFTPDPDKGEFIVNSLVGPDGAFSLVTRRATDKAGEQKPGAPAGTYKVVYMPDHGDQTAGGSVDPVPVPRPVTVAAGESHLTIELPAGKR